MNDFLLCPQCGSLLLESAPARLRGICRSCGWRGAWRRTHPLPLPPAPPRKGLLLAGGESLWLAGPGQALAFSPSQASWRSLPLPGDWQIRGLALAGGILIAAPGESQTVGAPKPLLGLDPQSGQVRWRAESQGFQWTAPAADETLVCAVDSRGQAAVLHPQTGEPLWRNPPHLGDFPHLGLPPALSDSFVLFVTPQGGLRWHRRADGRAAGAWQPNSAKVESRAVCLGDAAFFYAGDGLYCLDLVRLQAQELFRAPRRSSQGWFFAAPLLTPLGALLLHADFDPQGRASYALRLLDLESAQTRWTLSLPRHPYFAPALLDETTLLLPDRAGHLLWLNLADGETRTSLPLEGEEPAAAPAALGGMVFLLTANGRLLRFSPDLEPDDLPDSPSAYLERGEWEKAALKHALHGSLEEAAQLYRLHHRLAEARALYEMAGDAQQAARLVQQGAAFRLRLRADSPLRAGHYSLLEAQLENAAPETACDVRLTCSSRQMDIPQRAHRFGDLTPGEAKTWSSLQVRPAAGNVGELLLTLSLSWNDAQGKRRRLRLEQGLTVLQAEQAAARAINIYIGGNVTDSVIVAGDENQINAG